MSVWVRPVVAGMLLALGACSLFEDEEVLPGDRVRVRQDQAEPAAAQGSVALPGVREPGDWTQTNGNSAHHGGNLAGPTDLTEAWRADVGQGDSDAGAITGAPIVIGGLVIAMDASAEVAAFDTGGGAERWRTDVSPEGEDGEEGFGGGLAAEGGRVFVTTGFGEVLALEAATGAIVWRQKLGAPFRAAPAAAGGLVVAVTRDNRAFGLDGASGEIRWRLQGVSSDAGLLGGSSPALAQGLVVLPYGSGELVGAEPVAGRRIWTAVLSGGRRGLARAAISDVTGGPVIVGPLVVAANQSGRMVAIDGRNGRRAWTRTIGATRPIWAAEDTLFVVSDDMKLMRLATASGATLWESPLAAFEDPEDREDPITYSGPVLVAGRVILTDSLGNLHAFDGVTGVGSSRDLGGAGSVTGPVVSGGTVFVLGSDGVLRAYR